MKRRGIPEDEIRSLRNSGTLKEFFQHKEKKIEPHFTSMDKKGILGKAGAMMPMIDLHKHEDLNSTPISYIEKQMWWQTCNPSFGDVRQASRIMGLYDQPA